MIHRITLLKSWTNSAGRTYPVGQIITGTKELCQGLIDSGSAIAYEGLIPPTEKIKTDFFKPKKKK